VITELQIIGREISLEKRPFVRHGMLLLHLLNDTFTKALTLNIE